MRMEKPASNIYKKAKFCSITTAISNIIINISNLYTHYLCKIND